VADPENFEKRGEVEDKASAPSSFIAYGKKRLIEEKKILSQ